MASDKRPIIKLRSTAGTGFTYVTTKNKTNRASGSRSRSTTRSSASTWSSRKSAEPAASASPDADLGFRRCRRPHTAPSRCSTPASGSHRRTCVDRSAPNEDLVYFGDTGRYPYGPRPHDEVRGYAHQITEWMVEAHDPKIVVVACNTATAVALDELQARFDVPVIGVVEPGLGAVLAVTDTDRVGVIGTVGTIASGAYQRAAAEVAPHVELTCAACPGFVEFVERGETDSEQVRVLAQRLWHPSPARSSMPCC